MFMQFTLSFSIIIILSVLQYFPDRFVKREINALRMICKNHHDGCFWEGKFSEFESHLAICLHSTKECQYCFAKVPKDKLAAHMKVCPNAKKKCPLAIFDCSERSAMCRSELDNHIRKSEIEHLELFVGRIQRIEEVLNIPTLSKPGRNDPEASYDIGYQSMFDSKVNTFDFKHPGDFVESDGMSKVRGAPHSLLQVQKEKMKAVVEDPFRISQSQDVMSMVRSEVAGLRSKMFASVTEMIQTKEEEIASLRTQVTKLEKLMRSKNAELEDRDFRLSLIENSNHDGTMIWKIPQFSQRKADAESGKYTSIFSLPFYSGRYGYKMCLRLYIMGDGIGKGTHLSLFFVVMRGEFDNILQWPFTHKVTFKLINQSGGRDIVDTFQPDPMSSSFRKPKSDMNIASGCPRFVSHTELERGGFIVDDTIFIKCIIDTSTIRHP